MLSECRHRGFVYGLDYCPECGETDISKLLHERYIHELKARIAELEAELKGTQIARESELLRLENVEAENQRMRGAIELCERCRPYAHGAGTCKKSLDDMMALLGGGE